MEEPVISVQTKRDIEQLLDARGLRPRKRFGQNFLIDGNLMRRLAQAADLSVNDVVIEVGPGTGGLSDLIAPRVSRLVCVEIDRDLHTILGERFADSSNVRVILGDVLESKHRLHADLVEEIAHAGAAQRPTKLVANLPYQVATPLIMNLLVNHPGVRRLCFTVQAEVGERILAPSRCKDYGPLSIISQILCEAELIARLPPEAFWPRPMVNSVMLRLTLKEPPFASREELHRFVNLVRGAFDHRRKTLRVSLGYCVDEATRDRICSMFDGRLRPEEFSVEEWVRMASVGV